VFDFRNYSDERELTENNLRLQRPHTKTHTLESPSQTLRQTFCLHARADLRTKTHTLSFVAAERKVTWMMYKTCNGSSTWRWTRLGSSAKWRGPTASFFSALRRIADAGSHGRLEADAGLSWAQQLSGLRVTFTFTCSPIPPSSQWRSWKKISSANCVQLCSKRGLKGSQGRLT